MAESKFKKKIIDKYVVGIDLGTTNSVASIIKDNVPIIIPNDYGKNTTPSLVHLGDSELVGEKAKEFLLKDPENTIFASKRLIGRKFDDKEIKAYLDKLPYSTKPSCNGDVWIKTSLGNFSPTQIAGKILKKMKEITQNFTNEKIERAVVTVPAYFNDNQKQATKNAGKLAGLEIIRIINEPTAAALAYGLDKNSNGHVAVYDLGGGTFDISILELENGLFHVKATNGDTFLGGEDFDTEIVMFLAGLFEHEEGISVKNNKNAIQKLRIAAENAKKELSIKEKTKIYIENLIEDKDFEYDLKREQIENVVKKIVQRTVEPCKKAISDAKIKKSDIKHVVLVGGMTRMPLVRRVVEEIFGIAPFFDIDPDEAVAKGAAIQAGVLSGKFNDILLLDVTPLSLGIEVMGGAISKIIDRNTTIPFKQTETFTTSEDNQEEVDIRIYQGERPIAADNMLLGTIKLKNITKAPRGVPKIDVTFESDANGIIKVSAEDNITKEKQIIELNPSSGLTEEEIEKILKKAEEEKEKDEEKKKMIEFRIESMSYLIQLSNSKLPKIIEDKVKFLDSYLKNDYFDISEAKKHLEDIKKLV